MAGLVHRYRRPLAALCAATAVVAFGVALRPRQVVGPVVVVAARDVPFGARLSHEDVAEVRWATTDIPRGAVTDVDAVVGRATATALTSGELVTGHRLVGNGLQLPTGLLLVPIRLADLGVLAWLSPGDRLDISASGDSAGRVVAQGVRLVAVPDLRADRGSTHGRTTSSVTADSRTILVAASKGQAMAIASASSERLGVLLRTSPTG